jgi:hypothetical protein
MLMKSARPGPAWRRADPQPAPVGINVGIGAALMVAAGLVGAAVASDGWRLSVLALALAGFAAATLDQLALAPVLAIGFAILNGFLVNRYGQLSWHGPADLWRLMVLVMAAAVGLGLGAAYRELGDLRARWLQELEETEETEKQDS